MDESQGAGGEETQSSARAFTCVVVLGMHRSGTSALTRTLNLLGAALPKNLIPPRVDNQSGFWESADVQALNDRILQSVGSRWDDWRPLPALPAQQHAMFLDEAAAILRAAFADASLLVLKDPRICRVLPFWHEALTRIGASTACLLMSRSPSAIAASLAQRNGLSAAVSRLLWMRYLLDAERDSRPLPRAFVDYDGLLTDWRAVVSRIESALALRFPLTGTAVASEIDAFLRPDLRHHVAIDAQALPADVADLLESSAALASSPNDTTCLLRLDRHREAFDRHCALIDPPTVGPFGVPLTGDKRMPLARIPPSSPDAAPLLRMSPIAAAHAHATLAAVVTQPRFSVIMPTWNRADTLSRAIDSVLAQSLQPLELILCDDGSTDGTMALVHHRYAQALNEGRIRYLALRHGGASAARNAGLRAAQGEWIAYLDSDNTWHPDYLLMMAAAFMRNRHRRTAYACEHVHDQIHKRDFISWLPFSWQRLLLDNYIDINIFAHDRALFIEMGGFDEALDRLEDWELILRFTRVHPPQFVPVVLCDYYLDREDHLTVTAGLDDAKARVRRSFTEPPPGQALSRPDCLIVELAHDAEIDITQLADIPANVTICRAGATLRAPPGDRPVRQAPDIQALATLLHADAQDASAWHSTLHWAELVARDVQWKTHFERQAKDREREYVAQEKEVRAHLGKQVLDKTRELKSLEAALEEERKRSAATIAALQKSLSDERVRARRLALTRMRQQASLLRSRLPTTSPRKPPPMRAFGVALGPRVRLRLWREARQLQASSLFDPMWYLMASPDVAADGGDPVWHWLIRGWKEGRQPNPFFDTRWYLARYADVAQSGSNPLLHYLNHGAREDRDPGPLFSTRWYLEHNPDVADAGINPLLHYFAYGRKEGRRPCRWFDESRYLALNPDIAAANAPPLSHYLLLGGQEGRSCVPEFDAQWYLEQYPDVRRSGMHPLLHYLTAGVQEKRRPTDPAKKRAPLSPRQQTPSPAQLAMTSPRVRDLQIQAHHVTAARQQLARRSIGRFSIVMPTWNRAQCIERAIDSALAQSYTDWELIVCDDGSTDDTEQRLRLRYAEQIKAAKLRYLKLERAGVCAARNAGLSAANGQWIAYLDSDNAWHPDYLLIVAAAISANPERRSAYTCLQVRHADENREFIRCRSFELGALLARNFIDLNVFTHHRGLYEQLGGFDESLRRLVDWDLILRYSRVYTPLFVPFVLCDYYIDRSLNNITLSEPLAENERAVRRKFASGVVSTGAEPLRMAYVLWDWPALSQTFVLEELRELRRRGIDVRVYFAIDPDRSARELPDVVATRVADTDALVDALIADGRNWIHGHFAQPGVRDRIWPAAEKAGIAFSFMAHAVDIFPHRARRINRIGEVARSTLCARVVVHGAYHRQFLIEQGVPAHKIIMTPQAVDTAPIRVQSIAVRSRTGKEPLRVLAVARFVEKKGLEVLIDAIARLDKDSVEVHIHGYGPLESRYRERIRKLGLEKQIHLLGTFEGAAALRECLAWADVFCLPCVETEDGDADGMPTVFFEAMAAGVPCIGTTVSAIPDFIEHGITGYLVPPNDSAALGNMLRRVANTPAAVLAAIARAARDWTDEHLGARHTADVLLDVCAGAPLDIFMVTYHRDGHGDWKATERAISSVLEHTTTPMLLTVVDNGSDDVFLAKLQELVKGDDRIRIVPLGENRLCGPASNVALSMARSEFVFYVCSNEGYVARTGWERPCLRYMRNHPDVALAGHLVASPAWPDGRGYMAQSWFQDFRNPEFAEEHPDRDFFHVQGGLYVLRRSVFEKEGGFSDRRPQAQTDVEFSYYLESRGHRLGNIPELVVLSNKTRPGIEAFVDEHTVALHPVLDETAPLLRSWSKPGQKRCNVCGWSGSPSVADDDVSFDCPQCASSPKDRAVFRWLAGSNLHHRGKSLNAAELGSSVRDRLRPMFASLDDESGTSVSGSQPLRASRMLGIPPSLNGSDHQVLAPQGTITPRCNICGGDTFGPGPGGRKAVNGAPLPGCRRCGSLERHRAFRTVLSSLRDASFARRRTLQFSQDAAVDATWFAEHEVSIYGGQNSLDLQAVDRADESYDFVICNHVLEHVADDRAALRELFRILRPGGSIFLSVPDPLRLKTTRDWGHPDASQHGHYRTYGQDLFEKLPSVLPQAFILHITALDPVTNAPESCFLICKDAVDLQALRPRLDHFDCQQIAPAETHNEARVESAGA